MAVDQTPARRRFERLPVRFPVSLIKEAEGRIVERDGDAVDVSLRGLRGDGAGVSIRGLRVSTDLPLKREEMVGVYCLRGILGRFRVVWTHPGRSEAGLEPCWIAPMRESNPPGLSETISHSSR
jgi:hypothetical protein